MGGGKNTRYSSGGRSTRYLVCVTHSRAYFSHITRYLLYIMHPFVVGARSGEDYSLDAGLYAAMSGGVRVRSQQPVPTYVFLTFGENTISLPTSTRISRKTRGHPRDIPAGVETHIQKQWYHNQVHSYAGWLDSLAWPLALAFDVSTERRRVGRSMIGPLVGWSKSP